MIDLEPGRLGAPFAVEDEGAPVAVPLQDNSPDSKPVIRERFGPPHQWWASKSARPAAVDLMMFVANPGASRAGTPALIRRSLRVVQGCGEVDHFSYFETYADPEWYGHLN